MPLKKGRAQVATPPVIAEMAKVLPKYKEFAAACAVTYDLNELNQAAVKSLTQWGKTVLCKWDRTNLYPHQRLGSTGLDAYTTRLWEVMRSAWQATPAFVRLWHVGSVCMHVTLCALAQADPPEDPLP